MFRCKLGGAACLCLVSVVVTKHCDQGNLERRNLFGLRVSDYNLVREAEVGAEVEAMAECCWLLMACSVGFLFYPRPTCLGMALP